MFRYKENEFHHFIFSLKMGEYVLRELEINFKKSVKSIFLNLPVALLT